MKRTISVILTLTVLLCLLPACLTAEATYVAQEDLRISGEAYYDAQEDMYVLTEERTWQSGALWFDQVRCNDNFAIELDFYTGHNHYTNSYGGADGICVAFYADGSKVGDEGNGLGFEGCGGFGIELDTYYNSGKSDPRYNHIAVVHETNRNHLCEADATAYTEDGQWHHLRIRNRGSVCTVFVDGQQVLEQDGVEPNGQYQIGICAATGEGYNFQAVRHIELLEAVWTDASDWSENELERAQQYGLIPTALEGKDMTMPISRSEFAAVAVRVFENLTSSQAEPIVNNPFTDTDDLEVLKAYQIGAVNGTSATTFEPDIMLNREQCATMLTRVFKRVTLAGWTLNTDAAYPLQFEMPPLFSDDAEISNYARESVYFMVSNNIIRGIGDNLFAPKNTTSAQEAECYAIATREQALAIAVRMVENLK